ITDTRSESWLPDVGLDSEQSTVWVQHFLVGQMASFCRRPDEPRLYYKIRLYGRTALPFTKRRARTGAGRRSANYYCIQELVQYCRPVRTMVYDRQPGQPARCSMVSQVFDGSARRACPRRDPRIPCRADSELRAVAGGSVYPEQTHDPVRLDGAHGHHIWIDAVSRPGVPKPLVPTSRPLLSRHQQLPGDRFIWFR